MKRLNLLYKPDKKYEKYPWLLIHPKIKHGLARFQNRADAIDWFLNRNDEVYIWFQNNEGIFGGQLAYIESDDKSRILAIPKVSGFDGGDVYDDVCQEFSIHPSYLTRDVYKKALEKKVPLIDFELLSDPETYFPQELEAKKRQQSAYFDLNSIKASLELKIKELEEQKNVASETIDGLKEKLNNKNLDFMQINDEIDLLQQSKDEEIEKIREEYENKVKEAEEKAKQEAEEAARKAAEEARLKELKEKEEAEAAAKKAAEEEKARKLAEELAAAEAARKAAEEARLKELKEKEEAEIAKNKATEIVAKEENEIVVVEEDEEPQEEEFHLQQIVDEEDDEDLLPEIEEFDNFQLNLESEVNKQVENTQQEAKAEVNEQPKLESPQQNELPYEEPQPEVSQFEVSNQQQVPQQNEVVLHNQNQQQYDPYGYGAYNMGQVQQYDPYQATNQYYPEYASPRNQIAQYDPNSNQIVMYDAQYGYPTGMYSMHYFEEKRKKDAIAWTLISLSAVILFVIFIICILVLLSITNVIPAIF